MLAYKYVSIVFMVGFYDKIDQVNTFLLVNNLHLIGIGPIYIMIDVIVCTYCYSNSST